jgi:hypothetical protein
MAPRNPPPEPPSLQQLQDSIHALIVAFTTFQATQNDRHSDYLASFESLNSQISPHNNRSPSADDASPSIGTTDPPLKPPKLRLSQFDGSNPLDWIFQAKQFFTHYSIPPFQRLTHVASYMSGDALGWFQWMYNNHLLSTWEAFTTELEVRFGPSSYDNHQQALFKLKQTTSVAEYQREFERLCNRVTGLSPIAIDDCFVSGLKFHIQNDLAIHRPTNISQAIGLAKLIESKFLASRSAPSLTSKFPPPKPPLLPTPSQKLLPNSSTPTSHLPIRRLSPAEMQLRRSKGLCFNCDDRFHKDHRCKPKFLLMLGDAHSTIPINPIYAFLATEPPDPTSPPPPSDLLLPPTAFPPEPTTPTSLEPELFQLSLQAVTGQPSPRTLRFVATIHGHPLTILVDSGSSHNIIQPQIATFLRLPIQPMSSFTVMVGNGDHLNCTGLCVDTPLVVDDHTFTVSLYVLPIQGADVVLGVHWLQTLGPFVSDFTIPSMQFYHQDSLLTITGTKPNHATLASFHQLTCMLHTHAIDSFHSISMVSTTQPPTITPTSDEDFLHTLHPDLQVIIHPFLHIFSKPKSLPPCRPHDHHIHLEPSDSPINIKSYRYLFTVKFGKQR